MLGEKINREGSKIKGTDSCGEGALCAFVTMALLEGFTYKKSAFGAGGIKKVCSNCYPQQGRYPRPLLVIKEQVHNLMAFVQWEVNH